MSLTPYSTEDRARQLFNDMMFNGIKHRLVNRITGKRLSLLAFEEVRDSMQLAGQHDAGLQTLEICQIIGSVGRSNDFDAGFHLVAGELTMRWMDIARAIFNGREMPPIEVYKVDNNYFVIDGNHRVSVMKTLGQDFIEAHVIEMHLEDERCQTQELPTPRFER
jgi:uncharacterized ParB-like nuclease family protein